MFFLYNLITEAHAMGVPAQNSGRGGGPEGFILSLFPLVVIFLIFYLLLIRPQQKRAKEQRKLVDSIRKGDKVITTSGIHGVIESIGIQTFTLKVNEGVSFKIGKEHIRSVIIDSGQD